MPILSLAFFPKVKSKVRNPYRYPYLTLPDGQVVSASSSRLMEALLPEKEGE